jgi:heterodisulfide reductase subunit C
MDISPTRMMHLLQLESAFAHEPAQAHAYAHKALSSDTPWLCAGCLACTTRCPQNVDIAGAMDVLRQESLRRGVASDTQRARDVQTLHKVFLSAAMNKGRLHELSLVMNYKLRTGHLFQDALLALPMYLKGKLHIAPPKSPDTTQVRNAVDQLNRKGAAK